MSEAQAAVREKYKEEGRGQTERFVSLGAAMKAEEAREAARAAENLRRLREEFYARQGR